MKKRRILKDFDFYIEEHMEDLNCIRESYPLSSQIGLVKLSNILYNGFAK